MGTSAVTGPAVASNYTNSYYAAGLQITEFFNSSTDYLFLSVLAFGSPTGDCGAASLTNGCVLGFNVTSGTISPRHSHGWVIRGGRDQRNRGG